MLDNLYRKQWRQYWKQTDSKIPDRTFIVNLPVRLPLDQQLFSTYQNTMKPHDNYIFIYLYSIDRSRIPSSLPPSNPTLNTIFPQTLINISSCMQPGENNICNQGRIKRILRIKQVIFYLREIFSFVMFVFKWYFYFYFCLFKIANTEEFKSLLNYQIIVQLLFFQEYIICNKMTNLTIFIIGFDKILQQQ